MALAIEHDLAGIAAVQRVGWSDEELDAVSDRNDISAVVIDVTYLQADRAVRRLVDLFDCPVVALTALDAAVRMTDGSMAELRPLSTPWSPATLWGSQPPHND